MAKFKSMEEARWWAIRNKKRIKEYDCPMINLPNPTIEHLGQCGMVCENKWCCTTYTDIFSDEEGVAHA